MVFGWDLVFSPPQDTWFCHGRRPSPDCAKAHRGAHSGPMKGTTSRCQMIPVSDKHTLVSGNNKQGSHTHRLISSALVTSVHCWDVKSTSLSCGFALIINLLRPSVRNVPVVIVAVASVVPLVTVSWLESCHNRLQHNSSGDTCGHTEIMLEPLTAVVQATLLSSNLNILLATWRLRAGWAD